MAQVFALPDPGEGIHEAEILDVCVAKGDTVQEGEIILHIETDKAVVEVPSPYTGTVAEIKVSKGDVVRVGAVLMTFTGEAEQETACSDLAHASNTRRDPPSADPPGSAWEPPQPRRADSRPVLPSSTGGSPGYRYIRLRGWMRSAIAPAHRAAPGR